MNTPAINDLAIKLASRSIVTAGSVEAFVLLPKPIRCELVDAQAWLMVMSAHESGTQIGLDELAEACKLAKSRIMSSYN